ncbi:MAG TPA: T9SS type A sorting domain-containing protein, partial [Saprospiraceae bacterium]|nr:T9SS type A sorting domain-containing protein [Saprospiraceae bacterium]
ATGIPLPVPDSIRINWNLKAGTGSPTNSSDNPLLVTGLTAGATTTYVLQLTNNWCPSIRADSVNISPVANTAGTIAINSGVGSVCSKCIVPDGITKTFYATDGKIIGKIEDDGVVTPDYLDSTEVCVKVVSPVPTILDNFGLNQPYLQRYWTVKPTTNTNSIVTLYFTTTELNNLQTFAAAQSPPRYQFSGYNLYVTKFPGGGNGTYTAPCTGACASSAVSVPSVFGWDVAKSLHYVSFTINSFSTFYVHPALFPFAPLPVELISFTGYNDGAVNKLQWKTASEKNTLKFEVQKSLDATTWSAIGEKVAAGNSTIEINYDFNDNNPVIGNNYYRLKIIDNDGTFNFSNVINIPISNAIINSFVQVYPNPTNGILNVEIQSTSAYDIKMTTFDVLGKKVLEKSMNIVKGLNTLTIDYSILAKGTYVLQYFDSEGKTHTTKFVKD